MVHDLKVSKQHHNDDNPITTQYNQA